MDIHTMEEAIIAFKTHVLNHWQQTVNGDLRVKEYYTAPHKGAQHTVSANHISSNAATYLHVFARNERMNVTGKIDHDMMYPGVNDAFMTVRILRTIVKASIATAVVQVRKYGGYGSQIHELPKPFEALLVDFIGFQWQDDIFNSGGIFFHPNDRKLIVNKKKMFNQFSNWKNICQYALLGRRLHVLKTKDRKMKEMSVKWKVNGTTHDGKMYEEHLIFGFAIEFAQALYAVQSSAKRRGKTVVFRFLQAGLGFFCSRLDHITRQRLPRLRLEGIIHALEHMDSDYQNIHAIQLPFTKCDANDIGRLQKACSRLEMIYMHVGGIDALAPLEKEHSAHMLAVTNNADPHAAIGNEGNYDSVDAAIYTNTVSYHMNLSTRWRADGMHTDNIYAKDFTNDDLNLGEMGPESILKMWGALDASKASSGKRKTRD